MNTEIIRDITNGTYDNDIDAINKALVARRKAIRLSDQQFTMITTSVGDRVRTEGLNPKYMNGLTGRIVEKKRTRLVVEFDDGQNTGRFGSRCTVPASAVEVIR